MSRIATGRGQTIAMILVFLVFLIIGSSACDIFPQQTTTTVPPPLKFAVIADGPVTEPFWTQEKQGIDRAAAAMRVTVSYESPGSFDASTMTHLIDSALATKPDGLVVAIPDCSRLTPAIKRAQLVGIPVISTLSASDCTTNRLELLNYIGQNEYQIGLESGQKLAAAGARHVLCINEEVGNPYLDNRCLGINDALTQVGGKSEVLAVDSNVTEATLEIQAKLAQDHSINAIMTLDSTEASSALAAAQQVVSATPLIMATFGVSSDIFQAIQTGNMLFAIDQNPYERGYQSIVLLNRYKKHQNVVATTSTDPIFITMDNLQQVEGNQTPGSP